MLGGLAAGVVLTFEFEPKTPPVPEEDEGVAPKLNPDVPPAAGVELVFVELPNV